MQAAHIRQNVDNCVASPLDDTQVRVNVDLDALQQVASGMFLLAALALEIEDTRVMQLCVFIQIDRLVLERKFRFTYLKSYYILPLTQGYPIN